MSEVKVNIEEGKVDDEDVSYTLRGIPAFVHKQVISFQREIAYKQDKKFNLEQSYVEAMKDWANNRIGLLQKSQAV